MSYCIHLKKRKNKPYCKLNKEEITSSRCRECDKKEYKIRFKGKLLNGNKSNKLARLERNRYSVFTNDLEHCYLCSRKKDDFHEVFRGRNRINSIKYGFVIPLCRECHFLNQNNPFFNDYWHKQGQMYWESNIGSRSEFIEVFRRSYLE